MAQVVPRRVGVIAANTMRSEKQCSARAIVRLLGDLRQQVDEFCSGLRGNSLDVQAREGTQSGIECRNYRSGSVIEVWVEHQIEGGSNLVWFLNVRVGDVAWVLDGTISRNGSDTLARLPEKQVDTVSELERAVPAYLRELFRAGTPWLHTR